MGLAELDFVLLSIGELSSRYKNINYYKEFVHSSEQLAMNTAAYFNAEYWKNYFIFRIVY